MLTLTTEYNVTRYSRVISGDDHLASPSVIPHFSIEKYSVLPVENW
jgi:hypothetical protein